MVCLAQVWKDGGLGIPQITSFDLVVGHLHISRRKGCKRRNVACPVLDRSCKERDPADKVPSADAFAGVGRRYAWCVYQYLCVSKKTAGLQRRALAEDEVFLANAVVAGRRGLGRNGFLALPWYISNRCKCGCGCFTRLQPNILTDSQDWISMYLPTCIQTHFAGSLRRAYPLASTSPGDVRSKLGSGQVI